MRPYQKWAVGLAAGCLLALAAQGGGRSVTRSILYNSERQVQGRIQSLLSDNPDAFVDLPRGYYLDNFGVIFVSTCSLAPGIGITPFRGPINRQEIRDHKSKVLARVPQLKETMKTSLLETAGALSDLPDEDRVAIAVTVYHFEWEDTADVPSEIVVQGKKKDLLAARTDASLRDKAIELKEMN